MNMALSTDVPSSRSGGSLKTIFSGSTQQAFRLLPKRRPGGTNTHYPFIRSGIAFGDNPNDPLYNKLHIGLTKDTFQRVDAAGDVYPGKDGQNGFKFLRVEGSPETILLSLLEDLERGGGPYGWDLRLKYQEQNRSYLLDKIKDPETQLYEMHHAKGDGSPDEKVGFCLLSGIKLEWAKRSDDQGINKWQAVLQFAAQEKFEDQPSAIEIDKLAIFPWCAGQGYGKALLSYMARKIFNELNYNIIYLDSRSTNPPGTEEFYLGRYLRAFGVERLLNDLVQKAEWPPAFVHHGIKHVQNAKGLFVPQGNGVHVNDHVPVVQGL